MITASSTSLKTTIQISISEERGLQWQQSIFIDPIAFQLNVINSKVAYYSDCRLEFLQAREAPLQSDKDFSIGQCAEDGGLQNKRGWETPLELAKGNGVALAVHLPCKVGPSPMTPLMSLDFFKNIYLFILTNMS